MSGDGWDLYYYLFRYIGYTNRFASFVYKDLCQRTTSNFCVCPFEAEILVNQLHMGARGATAEEIRRKLNYSCTAKGEVRAHFHISLRMLNLLRPYMVKNVKKIYFQENLEVYQEFREDAASYYYIDSRRVNFRQKEIVERINAEIQAETFPKANTLQIVRSNILDESMKFYLVSACFYVIEFKKLFTCRALKRFYPVQNDPICTLVLKSRSYYRYLQSEALDGKLVKLDLKKKGASMIIVRPNLSSTVDDIMERFDILLGLEHANFEDRLVDIELPIFRMEVSLDFKSILERNGIERIFTSGVAELNGIVGDAENFMVDGFTQKIFLQMDESVDLSQDTGASSSSGKFPPPEVILFMVNRPFVFLIKVDNIVIVAGRVMHPNMCYHIIGNSYLSESLRVFRRDKKDPSEDKKHFPSDNKSFPSTSKNMGNCPSSSTDMKNAPSTSKDMKNPPSTSKDMKNAPSTSKDMKNAPSTSKDMKNSPNTPKDKKDKKGKRN